jgi:uroporphyrinogen-III synthase
MNGRKVAVLESRLGKQMIDLIAKRGGVPFHCPALAEIPVVDHAFVSRLVNDLQEHPVKVAIFQTGVGTRALFHATDTLGITEKLLNALAEACVVVRGPKPTAALNSREVHIDLSARDPFTTHEVLEAMRRVPLAGERVLVQRYGVTNVELDQALHARGAKVIEIPTYRWALPEDIRPLVELMDALDGDQIHAVTFTNAAQVYNLFAVAESSGRADALRAGLNRTLVASVGPVSSAALTKFGVAVGLESSPPKLGPLIAALDDALSR